MEFRFQHDEANPSSFTYSPSPPHPPLSSTSTYFTEQALRMGYFSNGIRRTPDLVRNLDIMREEIQVELEKERIREAVIAAEIVRKQTELRKEMMIERDLAIRRAEFTAQLLHRHHQNHYPDDSRFHDWPSFSSSPEIDPGFLFRRRQNH